MQMFNTELNHDYSYEFLDIPVHTFSGNAMLYFLNMRDNTEFYKLFGGYDLLDKKFKASCEEMFK